MKHYLFTIAFIFVVVATKGQTISFGYDASGNRTTGNIGVTKTLTDVQEITSKGIFDLKVEEISITPNPTKGLVKINIPDISLKPILQVTMIDGRTVARITITDIPQYFDISSYPDGIYLFQVINGTEIETWKIIKQ